MKRILVVDDHPGILAGLRAALEPRYAIETALDAFQALRLLESSAFDLLLVDLLMPGLDGVGFLRVLEERGIRTPVLLMSASRNVAGHAKGLQVAGVLKKPFDLEDLEARIARATGGLDLPAVFA